MKRPGKKAAGLVAAAVLAAPVLWGLILLLLPMGWARDRVVASIRRATRQEVRLAGVRLRPFGGIALSGLEIAAPGSEADPWLTVESMTVDVRARDLIGGRIAPTECLVSGMTLRILRDEAGRLEFEDLLKGEAKPAPAPSGSEAPRGPAETAFRIEGATIRVEDRATDTRLEFTEVAGLGFDDGLTANLAEMTGSLNGGGFALTARAERGLDLAIEGRIQCEGVALGAGTKAIAYFLPLVAGVPDGPQAQGALTFDLDLHARGETAEALVASLTGRGSARLEDLTLDDSRVMEEVKALLPVPVNGRLGSLRGDFRIADRRVTTANTVLKIAEVPIGLTGWSDLDGRLDYLVRSRALGKAVSGLARRLPAEARELLEGLPVDDLGGLVSIRVTGTLDRLIVKPSEGSALAKARAAKGPDRRAEDRAKLKAAGKKLLDRVLR